MTTTRGMPLVVVYEPASGHIRQTHVAKRGAVDKGGIHAPVAGIQWWYISASGWHTMVAYIRQWLAYNGGIYPPVAGKHPAISGTCTNALPQPLFYSPQPTSYSIASNSTATHQEGFLGARKAVKLLKSASNVPARKGSWQRREGFLAAALSSLLLGPFLLALSSLLLGPFLLAPQPPTGSEGGGDGSGGGGVVLEGVDVAGAGGVGDRRLDARLDGLHLRRKHLHVRARA